MKHRVETVMEIIAKRVMNKPYENSDENQAKTRPTNPSENLPGEFLEAVFNSVFTVFGDDQKFTQVFTQVFTQFFTQVFTKKQWKLFKFEEI